MDTLIYRLDNGREQQVACATYTTAKDNPLRADHAQDVPHSYAKVASHALQDPLRNNVSLDGSLDDDFRIDTIQVMVDQLSDPGCMAMHDFLDTHGCHG